MGDGNQITQLQITNSNSKTKPMAWLHKYFKIFKYSPNFDESVGKAIKNIKNTVSYKV